MLELKLLEVKSYSGMDTVFLAFLQCRGPLVSQLMFAAKYFVQFLRYTCISMDVFILNIFIKIRALLKLKLMCTKFFLLFFCCH